MSFRQYLLPLTRHSLFNVDWPYHWCLGWDLINQREVACPLFIVDMSRDERRLSEFGAFQISSNGLTSGNNSPEALTAGILEVIERDATTLWRLAWQGKNIAPPLVQNGSILNPMIRDLLDQLSAARVGTLLFDCRVNTQVPVFLAYIYDFDDGSMGVYKGYGAHLDPAIAAIRAITEAVQTRVIYIAGSHDDFFKQQYYHMRHSNSASVAAELTKLAPRVDWNDAKSQAGGTFEEDVDVLLAKLIGAGLSSVIVHDLTEPKCPVTVLKVVIPGAEGYMFDWYAPGARASAFLRARSQ
jgi:ribosomal protein S12 methylthiotransferase accessory factor